MLRNAINTESHAGSYVRLNKIFVLKIVIFFAYPSILTFVLGAQKKHLDASHQDGSFEYPQHMFWLRNKKINFYKALLSRGLLAHIRSPTVKDIRVYGCIQHKWIEKLNLS